MLKLKDHGNLKNVISLDPLSPETEKQLKKLKFEVFYFSDAAKKPDSVEDYKNYKVDR